MNDYRHNRVQGHTFFFTVRLSTSIVLTEHIAAFGEAIRQARTSKPFHVDAWVALPDHAHLIWTLPPDDHDCARRWRAIKIAFSKSLRKAGEKKAAHSVWERRFRQHPIDGAEHYRSLIDHLHSDPVRHGLCAQAGDWPWSSLHRFTAAGWIVPHPHADVLT